MVCEVLKGICIEARRSRDAYEPLHEQHHCKEVSLAICYKAAEAGMILCFCWGTFSDSDGQPQDHFWVRHEGVIYDATADQFHPSFGQLYIVDEPSASNYKESNFVIFNPMVFNIIKNMK